MVRICGRRHPLDRFIHHVSGFGRVGPHSILDDLKFADRGVISPFKVAREPARNLLDRLGEALSSLGIPTDGLDLAQPPDDPTSLSGILDETLRRLEQETGAWVLLPLDQAEALVAAAPGGDFCRSRVAAAAGAIERNRLACRDQGLPNASMQCVPWPAHP